jgi:hypothetical protein
MPEKTSHNRPVCFAAKSVLPTLNLPLKALGFHVASRLIILKGWLGINQEQAGFFFDRFYSCRGVGLAPQGRLIPKNPLARGELQGEVVDFT